MPVLAMQARRRLRLQVAAAILQQARNTPQAGDCRADKFMLRSEAVQEQGEHATQSRIQLRFGLPPPRLPVVKDRPPVQLRAEQVAIEALVKGGTRRLGLLVELAEPGSRATAAIVEGYGRACDRSSRWSL
jgi:hypothetical protein